MLDIGTWEFVLLLTFLLMAILQTIRVIRLKSAMRSFEYEMESYNALAEENLSFHEGILELKSKARGLSQMNGRYKSQPRKAGLMKEEVITPKKMKNARKGK